MDEEHRRARSAVGIAAKHGTSLVTALRQFKAMPEEELAARTGMPVARFRGEAEGRLAFNHGELDQVAAGLGVEVDLLMD